MRYSVMFQHMFKNASNLIWSLYIVYMYQIIAPWICTIKKINKK
jgi:hypothetical protein